MVRALALRAAAAAGQATRGARRDRFAAVTNTAIATRETTPSLAEVLSLVNAGERQAARSAHTEEVKNKAGQVLQLYTAHASQEIVSFRTEHPGAQTLLNHSLCTVSLAEAEGADEEARIAALVHGCGHLLAHCHPAIGWRPDRHMMPTLLGAQFLQSLGFGERLREAIASQPLARRYLAMCPGYRQNLTEPALRSLHTFGGPMDREVAGHFQSTRHFELSVSLLRWSEAAERSGAWTAGDEQMRLELYRTMLEEHFLEHHRSSGCASPYGKAEVLRSDLW
mmetsp:Transcript_110313/g.213585  ORF Transcript_110313/g.213585 Transcript_110313/m.213585 type:complete len:281 (+) Transcript_110313:23-865(+)|eukprot:CAMPEP_0172717340 /NCGR_PEP_ID=MMETSP1074-20121228/71124_1 /TAXON_ID=2916 /ORGANISM="Ceratium fusus, Strain PA161109" /LENGTH=280 /DNA_ID=CAMNT_0013542257 /DNA_START=17 /DNA_END=859 /DNA_ORIENTATION=+